MIIDSLCEHTNYWLQSSSAASPPSQEQQEMTSSCTQVVPGKELFAPLEGRCCVVTPSAVSVLGESSSVCPWLHQELFQECHVNLAYFRDVRNPQESKPFAGWPGCSLLCVAGEVLSLFSLLYQGPCSRTPKPAVHLCQEPGFLGRQSSM